MPADATLEQIERLIRVDTTSRETNLPLIDQVEVDLRALGLEPVRVPSEDGRKANLLATIPAADGTTSGGIVLSGHTDVVPVDGQATLLGGIAPLVLTWLITTTGSLNAPSLYYMAIAALSLVGLFFVRRTFGQR